MTLSRTRCRAIGPGQAPPGDAVGSYAIHATRVMDLWSDDARVALARPGRWGGNASRPPGYATVTSCAMSINPTQRPCPPGVARATMPLPFKSRGISCPH
jgi:hypothetical protein